MKLTMRLGARSYDIILKRGALKNLSALINLNRKVFIVTDSGVPPQPLNTMLISKHPVRYSALFCGIAMRRHLPSRSTRQSPI